MKTIISQNAANREEWLVQLSQIITDPVELYQLLGLDPAKISENGLRAKQLFPLRVPREFVKRMEVGNENDPLLRQVMLSAEEWQTVAGFSDDPLDEKSHNALPNLLHKYVNRVLLITKNSCAINCRYCFRRHFPYQETQGNKAHWQQAIDYIQQHPEIDEVILSGGDPLMAKDHELSWLINQLEAIPHVKRLRIHSRLAIVIPARINDTLCQMLQKTRLQTLLVTHINHANEIDDVVTAKMARLKQHGVTLLNQSVLLKDVNDDVGTLKALSQRLFEVGVLPYYLHLLDKVQGAAHFLVTDEEAKSLMQALSGQVSGYLVPKLAREIGGESSKTLIHY